MHQHPAALLGEVRKERAEARLELSPSTRLYEQVAAEIPRMRKREDASERAHFIRESEKSVKNIRNY